jgi:hypothetical protein
MSCWVIYRKFDILTKWVFYCWACVLLLMIIDIKECFGQLYACWLDDTQILLFILKLVLNLNKRFNYYMLGFWLSIDFMIFLKH